MAPVLSRDNLSEQVARYLSDYIRQHNLKPGQSLPSEMQVGKELGVSRGIVREAFRSLVAAGLIEVSSGRRARVCPIGQGVLSQLFHHALVTDQVLPEQILEMRRVIEVGVVQLAAVRRLTMDVDRMHQLLAHMRSSLGDIDRYADYDVQFHQAIARATQNPLFALLVGSLREAVESSIRAGLRRRNRHQFERSLELHELVSAAIVAGDPEDAGRAMELHFDDAVHAVVTQSAKDGPLGNSPTST